MRCEKCNSLINTVDVMMNYEDTGGWYWKTVPISEDEKSIQIDIDKMRYRGATSIIKYVETIRCPECLNYPFIQEHVSSTTHIKLTAYKSEKICNPKLKFKIGTESLPVGEDCYIVRDSQNGYTYQWYICQGSSCIRSYTAGSTTLQKLVEQGYLYSAEIPAVLKFDDNIIVYKFNFDKMLASGEFENLEATDE